MVAIVIDILHSFLIYALVGSLMAFLLVKLLIKLKKIENPTEISKLMFIPLATPFLTVLGSYLLLNGECSVGVLNANGVAGILNNVCVTSYKVSGYVAPILLTGFVLALSKGLIGYASCQRLIRKNTGLVANNNVLEILDQLSLKVGIKSPKLIVTKHNFASCFTFGYKKPVIVISQGVLKYFEQDEIEAILAHEIGHIVRVDSLMGWLAQFLRDLLFFNPISFFVFRNLKHENEKAADDIAIQLTNKPLIFAETLIKFWKFAPKGFLSNGILSFTPNPAFAKDVYCLEDRIKRSIDEVISVKKSWGLLAHSGGILLLSFALLLIVC